MGLMLGYRTRDGEELPPPPKKKKKKKEEGKRTTQKIQAVGIVREVGWSLWDVLSGSYLSGTEVSRASANPKGAGSALDSYPALGQRQLP